MSFALTDLSPANPLKAPRSCVSFSSVSDGEPGLAEQAEANV